MDNDFNDGLTEQFITVEGIAARLGVPRSWVYAHADELGVIRLGKYLRFDWERTRALLWARPTPKFGVLNEPATPKFEVLSAR